MLSVARDVLSLPSRSRRENESPDSAPDVPQDDATSTRFGIYFGRRLRCVNHPDAEQGGPQT
jgi:hypothetical protein